MQQGFLSDFFLLSSRCPLQNPYLRIRIDLYVCADQFHNNHGEIKNMFYSKHRINHL